MLVDILQKIDTPLSKADFAKVLYQLIQPSCGGGAAVVNERASLKPYDLLQPILNEQYTLVFIKSLERKADQFTAKEISSILAHLYRYSYVSSISSIASLQLQPYVALNFASDGKHMITYETFDVVERRQKDRYLNDFKFIMSPIEFIEKPCVVKIPQPNYNMYDLESLYSYDKCDQYMAFQAMLDENTKALASSSGASSSSSRPSTSSAARLRDINRASRFILSRIYLKGFYYYGTNLTGGYYVFDK